MEAVEVRRQQAAQRLGLEVNQVETHRIELAKMREAGLLIDLDVHGISMFSARVTNAELGISADDVRRKRLRAGSKDLFPEHSRKLRSLEARARQNLSKYTFQVPAFGQWAWMPWTAYEAFQAKHQEILDELEDLKANCLAHYNEVREQNRMYFEAVALRAWKALLSGYAPGDKVVIQTAKGATFEAPLGKDRFVEYVVQAALAKMPLPEEIETDVRIDYRTSILYSDSEVAQDLAAEEQAAADLATAKATKKQAEMDMWSAEEQAKAKVEAFKQAELEHAHQQLAQMASPLDEALDTLKSGIYSAVSELLAGVRKNGGFRGRASGRAVELLTQWQQLNGGLLKDYELERALIDLAGEVKSYQAASGEQRQTQIGDIEAQLSEIAAMTSIAARKIARDSGSRAAALEF